jgi:hypothetical protein
MISKIRRLHRTGCRHCRYSRAADYYRKARIGITKTGLLIKAPHTGVPVQLPYLAIANVLTSCVLAMKVAL